MGPAGCERDHDRIGVWSRCNSFHRATGRSASPSPAATSRSPLLRPGSACSPRSCSRGAASSVVAVTVPAPAREHSIQALPREHLAAISRAMMPRRPPGIGWGATDSVSPCSAPMKRCFPAALVLVGAALQDQRLRDRDRLPADRQSAAFGPGEDAQIGRRVASGTAGERRVIPARAPPQQGGGETRRRAPRSAPPPRRARACA